MTELQRLVLVYTGINRIISQFTQANLSKQWFLQRFLTTPKAFSFFLFLIFKAFVTSVKTNEERHFFQTLQTSYP